MVYIHNDSVQEDVAYIHNESVGELKLSVWFWCKRKTALKDKVYSFGKKHSLELFLGTTEAIFSFFNFFLNKHA